MKHGILKYDYNADRFVFIGKAIIYALHCGDCLTLEIEHQMRDVRIELSDVDGWYVTDDHQLRHVLSTLKKYKCIFED